MTQSDTFDMTTAIPLPLTKAAFLVADRFAQYQPNPKKAYQVRLNTLAVFAIYDYLLMMGVPASLSGDSWNPVSQLMADVADLVIEGLGRLECRPTVGDVEICSIPAEVWHDRLAYLVVQIDEPRCQANLLGFVEAAEVEVLSLDQLQTPENLFDYLAKLQNSVTQATDTFQTSIDQASTQIVGDRFIALNQWLLNRFESGWESLELWFNSQQPQIAYSFRNSTISSDSDLIRRTKQIRLEGNAAEQNLMLVVEILSQKQDGVSLRFQVYHWANLYLSPGIRLAILDNQNILFLEVESKPNDNYIQLQFDAVFQEVFTAQIRFEDAVFTETFMV